MIDDGGQGRCVPKPTIKGRADKPSTKNGNGGGTAAKTHIGGGDGGGIGAGCGIDTAIRGYPRVIAGAGAVRAVAIFIAEIRTGCVTDIFGIGQGLAGTVVGAGIGNGKGGGAG